MKKFLWSLSMLMILAIGSIQAQENRAPSPSAKLMQKVGLTDVTIEYSRPGMKERTIFAKKGLVPFGKLWRTGANSATKITFSGPVTFGETELAAGSYAILTIPGAASWEVNFYSYEAGGWGSYREADPVATVKAEPVMLSAPIESFLITVDNLRDYSATLVMAWDKTWVGIPFTVK